MSAAARVGRTLLGVGALGAAVTVGAWLEAQAFIVRRVEAAVLPGGQRPLRVLHLSDLHLMPYQHRKIDFLSNLAGLRPDLVISTGDNIASEESIELLLDVPGAFVFGSHDFSTPTFRNPASYLFGNTSGHKGAPLPWWRVQEAFTDKSWRFVENQTARVEAAGRIIDLRGTGDAHIELDAYPSVAGPVSPDADLTLGVTHAPYRRVLDAMVADGLDMVFAGHTHGGQICLPVNRAIIANCDLPVDQANGLSDWTAGGHTAPLHVSNGIGTSPMTPIRLFCRPSATLVTLTARD